MSACMAACRLGTWDPFKMDAEVISGAAFVLAAGSSYKFQRVD